MVAWICCYYCFQLTYPKSVGEHASMASMLMLLQTKVMNHPRSRKDGCPPYYKELEKHLHKYLGDNFFYY